MAAGLEADRRQCGAQVARTGDRLPVQTSFPGLSGVAQARLATPAAIGFLIPLGVDFQRRRVAGHQAVAHAAAKAAPVGEQVDGLQDAGLAGAVVADKQVQARAGEEGYLGKAAQTPELKPDRKSTRLNSRQ